MSEFVIGLYIGSFVILTLLLICVAVAPMIRKLILCAKQRSGNVMSAILYGELVRLYYDHKAVCVLTAAERSAVKAMWAAYTELCGEPDDELMDIVFQMHSWQTVDEVGK